MAEPSTAQARPGFSRGTLVVGLVLITIAAGLAAYALAKMRRGPDVGVLVYAGPTGYYAHDLGTGSDRRLMKLSSGTVVAVPSQDGRFLAYSVSSGALWLVDAKTHQRYEISEQAALPEGWTPDNKLVARELTGQGDIVAIDPAGGRTALMRSPSATIGTPIWITKDRFAIGDPGDPKHTALVSLTAAESPVTTSDFGLPLAASPDGKELLVQRDHLVSVAKIRPDGLSNKRVIFHGDAREAQTSPQGFVAIAGNDAHKNNGIWVLQGGTQAKRVVRGPVDWFVWTPDGSSLVYERSGVLYALVLGHGPAKRVSRRGVKVFPLLSFTVVPKLDI